MKFCYDVAIREETPLVQFRHIYTGLTTQGFNKALTTRDDPRGTAELIVDIWLNEVNPLPTICFTSTTRAARVLSAAFNGFGVKAEWLGMGTWDRPGGSPIPFQEDVQVLCCRADYAPLLSIPRVAGVVICHPTRSLDLYACMVGACAVPCEGKRKSVVIDFDAVRKHWRLK